MAGSRSIGTTLTLKGTNGANDTVIAHLTSIGEIGLENEEIDVTDLDSPDDFKEYTAGSRDAGEVSISGNLVADSVVNTIYGLACSREVMPWEVTYPTGAKWGFNAFVKSFKDGEKTPDGLLTFTSALRGSGKPTFTMANNSSTLNNEESQGG